MSQMGAPKRNKRIHTYAGYGFTESLLSSPVAFGDLKVFVNMPL